MLPWVAGAEKFAQVAEATDHPANAGSKNPIDTVQPRARTLKRRAKHDRRSTGHIILRRTNPTAPGLDACGISGVAVCPIR
jgi:hypothetical protein